MTNAIQIVKSPVLSKEMIKIDLNFYYDVVSPVIVMWKYINYFQ